MIPLLVALYVVIGLAAGAVNFRRRWSLTEKHSYFFEGTASTSHCRISCWKYSHDSSAGYRGRKVLWKNHLPGTYAQSLLVTVFWIVIAPAVLGVAFCYGAGKGLSGVWNLALPESAKKELR